MSSSDIVSIALVLLTAFNTIIDKDELFTTPIKKKAWFSLSLLIVITVIQIWGNVLKKGEDEEEKIKTQRAKWVSDSTLTVRIDSVQKASQKVANDSIKSYSLQTQKQLAEFGLREDKGRNVIIKTIDSSHEYKEPVIDFGSEVITTSERGDSLQMEVPIVNVGDGFAKDISFYTELICIDQSQTVKILGNDLRPKKTNVPANAGIRFTQYYYNEKKDIFPEGCSRFVRVFGSYYNLRGSRSQFLLWYAYSFSKSTWGIATEQDKFETIYQKFIKK